MRITGEMVKQLREKTGAGIMDCKKALTENNGDLEKASEYLLKQGLAKASKKAGRIAAEGVIGSYIHSNARIGVIVEVNCETDFVARNEDFKTFAHDVAMQIAAMNPQYVKLEDVPQEELQKQRALYADSKDVLGKPANIAEKILEGKIKKWAQESCLLDQAFFKDPDQTIGQLQMALTAKIGEKISVRRFIRFEVGEGIEKRKDDFAQEVAAQIAASNS